MIDLEPLAIKLGVAVEHLWEVLLKQAPISGALDVLFYIFTAACVYVVYRLWLFIIRKVGQDGWGEAAYIWPALATMAVFFLVIASLLSLPVTLAAFFNPEYWALHKVLSFAKGC